MERHLGFTFTEASAFHFYRGNELFIQDSAKFYPKKIGRQSLYKQPPDTVRLLKLAMNINGVDMSGWPRASYQQNTRKKVLMKLLGILQKVLNY
jgi:hypothetical protein